MNSPSDAVAVVVGDNTRERLSHWPSAHPLDLALARRVAEVVDTTATAQLSIVREDILRHDALELVTAVESTDVRMLTPQRARRVIQMISVLDILLGVVFLLVGVYGFDKSSFTPCPQYWCDHYGQFYDPNTTCPPLRPGCLPPGDVLSDYHRLTTYPKTPSFAKFAYANLMGRSLVVLALLPALGRYPDVFFAVGILYTVISVAFLIICLCMAWIDMKGRDFGEYYQVPLTIVAFTSLVSPSLLTHLSRGTPTPPVTTNALVVRDAHGNDTVVVDDLANMW